MIVPVYSHNNVQHRPPATSAREAGLEELSEQKPESDEAEAPFMRVIVAAQKLCNISLGSVENAHIQALHCKCCPLADKEQTDFFYIGSF